MVFFSRCMSTRLSHSDNLAKFCEDALALGLTRESDNIKASTTVFNQHTSAQLRSNALWTKTNLSLDLGQERGAKCKNFIFTLTDSDDVAANIKSLLSQYKNQFLRTIIVALLLYSYSHSYSYSCYSLFWLWQTCSARASPTRSRTLHLPIHHCAYA